MRRGEEREWEEERENGKGKKKEIKNLTCGSRGW